jgi:hypothetical protein
MHVYVDLRRLPDLHFFSWGNLGQPKSSLDHKHYIVSCLKSTFQEFSDTRLRTPAWVGTAVSLLPSPTHPGSMNGSSDWMYNFAPGTRLDCLLYANGTQFGASASCADVAKGYGVDQTDLTQWNPSLNTTCTLNGNLTYCVRFLENNATDVTPYCVMDDTPSFNTSCDTFLAAWGLDLSQFALWNPDVGSNCENWDNGKPRFPFSHIASLCSTDRR